MTSTGGYQRVIGFPFEVTGDLVLIKLRKDAMVTGTMVGLNLESHNRMSDGHIISMMLKLSPKSAFLQFS